MANQIVFMKEMIGLKLELPRLIASVLFNEAPKFWKKPNTPFCQKVRGRKTY
jgi:hypothetical protein